jgi:hypothetical protein
LIKDCNIFGSKIDKHLQLWWRAHYCATRQNFERRNQMDESAECATWGDPLFLYKILQLLFFLVIRIFCALPLENKKIISIVLMQDLCNFSFFDRVDFSPTHSEICRFVSGS